MRDNLKILLQKLLNHDVDFVLAGGLACTMHGSPLVTQDIDICVAIDDSQLSGLRDTTRRRGPLHQRSVTVFLRNLLKASP